MTLPDKAAFWLISTMPSTVVLRKLSHSFDNARESDMRALGNGITDYNAMRTAMIAMTTRRPAPVNTDPPIVTVRA